MTDLRKKIARDALRRDLLDGVDLDDCSESDEMSYDIDAANDLMRRAAEEIDAMQAEIDRLQGLMGAADHD